MEKLIGRTIVAVRYLTQEELDDMDWYGNVPVLVFDDGTEIVASQDSEGNGPGVFFVDRPE
jgi:hypothetical protein